MSVDERLNARFRKAIGKRRGLDEKQMMGGTCFLLHGNMIGGADIPKGGKGGQGGRGRFMFRVGKERAHEALKRPGARPMEMGGRRMNGFVFVDADDCDEKSLGEWVGLALSFVETLPRK